MKKNCFNCVHLEYAFGDVGDPEGYVCLRKDFQGREEQVMLEKMDNEKYLLKSKVCFKKEENEVR